MECHLCNISNDLLYFSDKSHFPVNPLLFYSTQRYVYVNYISSISPKAGRVCSPGYLLCRHPLIVSRQTTNPTLQDKAFTTDKGREGGQLWAGKIRVSLAHVVNNTWPVIAHRVAFQVLNSWLCKPPLQMEFYNFGVQRGMHWRGATVKYIHGYSASSLAPPSSTKVVIFQL